MPGAQQIYSIGAPRHPLARMLPLQREQAQVYRLGEKHPPRGGLEGHGPMWEAVTLTLAARSSLQARVNLQRNFTLLAMTVTGTSNVNGGFRMQFYDMKRKLRFADRGVQQANIAGGMLGMIGAFFLREPYDFAHADSQMLVIAQNLETVANTIQVAFYGQVLRFNEVSPGREEFPGGPVSSLERLTQ
jgi:hypothetical protein